MSLEIILAPSGLGKTEYILEDIDKNRKNNKIIILTPEQNGYNFEKILCERFSATFNIDVMNFNSFSRMIAKKLFMDNRDILKTEVKNFYYLEIAKKLKNKNNFLAKIILQDFNFIEVIDEIISEFKKYDVDELQLQEYLKDNNIKLRDVLEFYSEYNKYLIEKSYIDNNDYISIISNKLEHVDISNYIFYIDGYYNFTKQEYNYIEKLIKYGAKVVISVIGDINRYINKNFINNIDDEEFLKTIEYDFINFNDLESKLKYKLDIYRKSHEVISNLNFLISKNKILNYKIISMNLYNNEVYSYEIEFDNYKIYSIKLLNKRNKYRYNNNFELSKLVDKYPKILDVNLESIKENKSLYIKSFRTREEEILQVARDIYKIKKDFNDIKDKDIAILYRDDNYEKYINFFRDYGINVHLDKDLDVSKHRLIKFITNILNYGNTNFKDDILNILKTNILDFSELYYRYLMKYILFSDFSISDKKLLKEIRINKEVLKEKLLEFKDLIILDDNNIHIKQVDLFELINILDEKLIINYEDINNDDFLIPNKKYSETVLLIIQQILLDIDKLIKKLHKQKTFKSYIKKIEDILNYFNVKMNMEYYSEEYEFLEELLQNSMDRQIYSKFLEILDSLLVNLGDEIISYDDFRNILIKSVNNIKYRSIPEIDNFVIMSNVDLAKVENKKVVFLIGFDKENYPKKISPSGIISDTDKENFIKNNIRISPTTKNLLVDEEFVSYIGISRSSGRLYISYTYKTKKEDNISIYFENIKKIFPKNYTSNESILGADNIISLDDKYITGKILLDSYNFEDIYTLSELNRLQSKLLNYKKSISRDSETYKKVNNVLYKIELLKNQENEKVVNKEKQVNEYIYKELADENRLKDNNYAIFYDLKKEENNEINLENNLEILNASKFLNFSASKLNSYLKNPYIFFVKYILNIKEISEYSINPLNTGNFYHSILDEQSIKDFILKESEKAQMFDDIDEYVINKNYIFNYVKKIVEESEKEDIKNYLKLINKIDTNKYLLKKSLLKITQSICLEIKYTAITGYKILLTEKRFEFNINKEYIEFTLDDKKSSRKIENKYNLSNVKFSGFIDRIDKNGKNYLVIDYKSSETDFNYNGFYNGEVSQLLTYIVALELMYNENTYNIMGAFYRQISDYNKEESKYRLRGLVNMDLLLTSDFALNSNKVMFTRVTKNKAINGGDAYKAYNSKELEKLVQINIDNILNIIYKIRNFEFYIEDELSYLYKYAFLENTTIEKEYDIISNKELRGKILDKANNSLID